MTLLSPDLSIPLVFMAIIVAVETILLWILVLRHKRLQTYNNCFLLSLSISDFMIGFFCNIMYIFLQEATNGYFVSISLTAHLFCILSLSIERHYAITRPFQYKIHIRKMLYILVAMSWFLAVFISLIPLACDTDASTTYHKVYLICYMILPVCVLFAIVILYVKILKTVQRRNEIFAENVGNNFRNQQMERQRLLNEWKITKVIMIITGLYISVWAPILYMTICVTSGYPNYIPKNLSQWAMITLVAHCVIDPLIYSFMKADIRDVIMNLCKSCWYFRVLPGRRRNVHGATENVSPPTMELPCIEAQEQDPAPASGARSTGTNTNENVKE